VEREGKGREEGERKGTGGIGPLSQIPGSAPAAAEWKVCARLMAKRGGILKCDCPLSNCQSNDKANSVCPSLLGRLMKK